MTKKYFGTDGIRGIANTYPMTPDIAMKIGIATGIIFNQNRPSNHPSRVVIGKDTRLSGYMLENSMVAGFTAAGMDVLLLGPIPTPAVSMLCRSMRADIGVMISASHNPYDYNGIKIFDSKGLKISDETEKKIEELIDNPELFSMLNISSIGRAKRIDGDIYRYIEFAKYTLSKNVTLDGLRIVIDTANGAAYKSAPRALWELGAEVISINDKPNGTNINEECGSTKTTSLVNKLKETRADIGIALDGDGDRVIIVDEKANIVDGDKILAILAKNWQKKAILANNNVVGTVMSNLGLERYLSKLNINLTRTKVGDRHVATKMQELGCNLGGEQSGHIILSDYATTGDGLITSLQVLSCAVQEQCPISELYKGFEETPQILKNVPLKNTNTLQNEDILNTIKLSEEKLGKTGRILVRLSGTEPLVRVMAEGDNLDTIKQIVDDICDKISKYN